MKDDTDLVLEAKSRKVQKISPTPDRSSPPHKEAKRSKSKRKRKKKSADRCDSPEHYGKRARKREKVVKSESVFHPRRHISPSSLYGSWRTPSGE